MSHRPNTRSRVAATALVALVALVVAPVVTAAAAVGAPTAPTSAATTALDWLADELDANGGSIPGFTDGSSDWGLTADAVLAFTAAGRGDDAAATTATDLLAADAATYTTWAPSMPEVRVAGPTAKLLLVLRTMERSPVADGVDLDAALRASILTEGPQAGRLADRVPDPSWDASNGFGQALGVLALTMGDGAPAPTLDFLLAQQCPSGGFRLTYGNDAGCASDDAADPDATALALQALLAQERTTPIAGALEAGTAWLLGRQGLDGSFGGAGPTAAANTNSTGLIAQFLRAAGQPAPAEAAANWITSTSQLTDQLAAGTAAANDVGAIAYNPAGRAAALRDGITAQTADQWRRATTQAVLALGLAPFGPSDVTPLPPAEPTPTTAPPTTAAPTTAVTVPQPADPSPPGPLGTPAGAPLPADDSEVLADGATAPTPAPAPAPAPAPTPAPPGVAGTAAGTTAAALATTGASTAPRLLAGALLMATGLILLGGTTIARHR